MAEAFYDQAKDPIIDRIPDLFENRKINRMGVIGLEEMPDYYHIVESDRLQYDEAHMLNALRNELQFSEKNEELVEHAYGVARNLADVFISQQGDKGQEAFRLLHETRRQARPILWNTSAGEEALGQHDRGINMFSVDHGLLLNEGIDTHRKQIEANLTLKNPEDAKLIAYLGTVGHEAGHALLGGISTYIESQNPFFHRDGLTASWVYMSEHPERGFTGNMQTDTWIQEERFAEGYGRLVMQRAMTVLGYDEDDIATVMKAVLYKPDFSGAEGGNQLDLLDGSVQKTGIGRHIATNLEASKRQSYEGELGYSSALKIDRVIEELADLSELITHNPRQVPVPSVRKYIEAHARTQDPDVKLHIQWLKQRRQEFLGGKTTGIGEAPRTRRQRLAEKLSKRAVKASIK